MRWSGGLEERLAFDDGVVVGKGDVEGGRIARLEAHEVILEPGDALYLPSRWWHQVRSLDVSVSFNYWFADGVHAMVVRAAEFVKRVRALEIYGLETRLRASGQLGTR